MTAENIAKALKGHQVGGGWMAPCPAHHDQKPSLSIREVDKGKVLVRCHAGCAQDSLITELRRRGLWPDNTSRLTTPYVTKVAGSNTIPPDCEDTERSKSALKIWQSGRLAKGTAAEIYLRSRGLHLPVLQTIRFCARLKHPSGSFWPAMVSLVTCGIDDVPLAIHRTFLARDGSGKAPLDPQKMMLGPCRSGAVRLAPAGDVLMVGEGIETCLAAMEATGHPAWAALSTSGLRTLDLPRDVRDVIVLADGDDAGEATARDAALRWKLEDRHVRIARPPQGMDFNDMLLGSALPNNGGR
jgi:hypothetical protein